MSEPIKIRPFKAEEWQIYRAIRLQALKDSPDAFGSTFEASKRRPDSDWQERLASVAATTELPLFATVADQPAGLAWAMIEAQQPNITHIYQMWVAPAYRRRGISQQLMTSALDWAEQQGTSEVVLEVTCGNKPAEALYSSLGFRVFGEPVQVRPDSPLMEVSMRLALPRKPR